MHRYRLTLRLSSLVQRRRLKTEEEEEKEEGEEEEEGEKKKKQVKENKIKGRRGEERKGKEICLFNVWTSIEQHRIESATGRRLSSHE